MSKLSTITFPEDNFIANPDTACAYLDRLQESHKKFHELVKAMEDHIDGKKPVPPEKLQTDGKKWVPNYNFGKARAKLEQVVIGNVSSVLNSMLLMSIGFKPLDDKEKADPELGFLQQPEYSHICASVLAGALNELVDREARMLQFMNCMEYGSTAWGWSAATRDPDVDWLGQPQHIRSILFEPDSRPDKVTGFATMDTISGRELWRIWSSFKNSENNETDTYASTDLEYVANVGGWNISGLEEALYFCYNHAFDANGTPKEIRCFEDVLPDFLKNPSLAISRTDSVSVATIFQFEFDGSITKTKIAYGSGWKGREVNGSYYRYGQGHSSYGAMSAVPKPKHFLFQFKEKLTEAEVLDLVFESGFATGGKISDMRGLAKLACEDSIRFNRIKNDLLTKIHVAGPLIRKEGPGGDAGPQIAPLHGFCVISKGYGLAPEQPKFDFNGSIAVLNMEEGHYVRETESYDPKLSGKLSSRPIRSEVESLSEEVRVAESSKASIKLRCYSKILLGIIKALTHALKDKSAVVRTKQQTKEGVEFFTERCLEQLSFLGVDSESKLAKVLALVDNLQMERALANPEAIIEQLSQATTDYDRAKFNRMLMLARGFSRKEVMATYPFFNRSLIVNEEWMAAQENATFSITTEVLFSPAHNPISHLNKHFPKLFGLLEQLMNGQGDPVPTFNWFSRLLEHAGFHIDSLLKLQYITEEEKTKYLQAYKQLLVAEKQVRGQIQEMAKRLAAQQEQATQGQGQPAVDPKVLSQIQNDRIKLESNIEIKKAASEFRAEEKKKDGDLRRKMTEETHQEKLRRSKEMEDLKNEITLLRASTQIATQQ